MDAEHHQGESAGGKADQQDFASPDAIAEIAHRGLGQAGYEGEYGKYKAEFDIADTELFLEKRKQHRQHEQMKMADPMRRRNRDQRAQRGVRLRLARRGQYIDHFDVYPVCCSSPAGQVQTIGSADYLSMNAAA